MLQWGRNFIVAETPGSSHGMPRYAGASMGPQLYRCGNAQGRKLMTAFMEASMGPQLYRCGNQNGHCQDYSESGCFNGAATLSLRKRQSSRLWAWEACRFNGAATLSLRKLDIAQFIRTPAQPASMGPQLYRCGNEAMMASDTVPLPSFNGAATLSLRKREPRDRIVANKDASMGPQLYRCGNH